MSPFQSNLRAKVSLYLLPCSAFSCSLLRLDLGPPSSIPSSPASTDSRTKRPNPLVDLIDTEKLYVDQLTGVIRVGCPFHCSQAPFLVSSLIIHIESSFRMVALKPPSS